MEKKDRQEWEVTYIFDFSKNTPYSGPLVIKKTVFKVQFPKHYDEYDLGIENFIKERAVDYFDRKVVNKVFDNGVIGIYPISSIVGVHATYKEITDERV